MESPLTFVTPPRTCEYLPDRVNQFQCEMVRQISPAAYADRLHDGWRRFGHTLFRPACPSCRRCLSLRVPVETFRPGRSQRRAWNRNQHEVRLTIGTPALSPEAWVLYDRFHHHQREARGWPSHDAADVATFIHNPLPAEEWRYRAGDRLIGVGYVDRVPGGLSAVYFYYDPDERDRSLGTFNVLSILAEARNAGLPHVYLGYYVEGYGSLAYKARFRPNEVLLPDGTWGPFAP
jgi:arginine-tRNA-protein transferase